jgi:transcriptional regulator with XRE-family HTH domain
MYNQRKNQDLRIYRKRSQLTQIQLAFLFGLAENTNICHWESGRREPDSNILLLYHLLFELPVETTVHAGCRNETITALTGKTEQLLAQLKEGRSTQKGLVRIAFLEAVLSRFSAQQV